MGKSLMRKVFFVKDKSSGKGEYITAFSMSEAIGTASKRLNVNASKLMAWENKPLKQRVNYKS